MKAKTICRTMINQHLNYGDPISYIGEYLRRKFGYRLVKESFRDLGIIVFMDIDGDITEVCGYTLDTLQYNIALCMENMEELKEQYEDLVEVLTYVVKHSDIDLEGINIAFGINDAAEVTMVRCEDDHTLVYITWNDGNEDSYEYPLPLERMVKINRDLRLFRICF